MQTAVARRRVLMSPDEIDRAIARMAHQIVEPEDAQGGLLLIGIRRGGEALARYAEIAYPVMDLALLAVTVRDPQERTVVGTVMGADHRAWPSDFCAEQLLRTSRRATRGRYTLASPGAAQNHIPEFRRRLRARGRG